MRPTSLLASSSRRLILGGIVLLAAGSALAVYQAPAMTTAARGPSRPAPMPSESATVTPTEPASSPSAPDTSTAVHLDASVIVQLPLRTGETITSTITPADLAAMVTSTETHTAIDKDLLRRSVDPGIFQVVKPMANARFRIVGDSVTVVPSRVGLQVTIDSLASNVLRALPLGGESRTVTLQPAPIPPTFNTADAQSLGVHELVSKYTQQFPAATYRTINIGQAARYISGTILRPGEVFSMNDTIKARTPENGYTSGWIIGPNGVFIMQQGGAVSTMTTAMFNAVWFSGMEFIEHRAHSIYIPRYPAGREATVSWGDFDMKFRNNLQHAVFITAKVHRTSVEVFIWGSRQWSSIGTVFGPWTNKVAYPVIRSADPACHPQDGMIGFRITTWRTFFLGGVEVRREPFYTRYQPSPQVICVKPEPTIASSDTTTA